MVLHSRQDGNYDLDLGPVERQVLTNLCGELRDALGTGETNPSLRRLFPPAYANDAEHERDYRSLVGDQLIESRRAALETIQRTCETQLITVDELDAWLTALNALRLVIGTQLDIGEQHNSYDLDERNPDFHAHVVYDFLTGLLAVVLMELGEQR